MLPKKLLKKFANEIACENCGSTLPYHIDEEIGAVTKRGATKADK